MLTAPRLRGKPLADLCHRLAISEESGIDVRRTWQREANAARGRLQHVFTQVRESLEAGESLSVAFARHGRLFPRLFLEMVHVGEQTGSLSEVLHRLSDHYQRQHTMARGFLMRLAWPMIEVVGAVVIIGVLIAVLGALGATRLNGEPIDVLGLGVTGSGALVLYIELVVFAAFVLAAFVFSLRRGLLWVRPLHHLVMHIPGIGPAIQDLCLARLAWALHLTLNVEMDLRRLVPLALRATGSDYYISRTDEITAAVAAGSPLHDAFTAAGIFPDRFLDALEVAETSGQLVESMSRLSKQYDEEAERSLTVLSVIASFAIWGGVMLAIGLIVIRLVKVLYIDMLNDAMEL